MNMFTLLLCKKMKAHAHPEGKVLVKPGHLADMNTDYAPERSSALLAIAALPL
jgi:hypothetical protein